VLQASGTRGVAHGRRRGNVFRGGRVFRVGLRVGLANLWLLALIACSRTAHETQHAARAPLTGGESEWFLTYLDRQLAGSLQVVTQSDTDGTVLVRMLQRIKVKRGTVPLEMEMFLETREDAKGRLLAVRSEQKLSGQTLNSTGRVENGVLFLEDRRGTSPPRAQQVPVPPEAVGLHAAEQNLRTFLGTAKEGETFDTVTFSSDVGRFGKETTTVAPMEEVLVEKTPQRLRRLRVQQELLPGVEFTKWTDANGQLAKMSMPFFGGMKLEYVRSTRERVLTADLESPPEVFLSASVPVNRSVPRGCEQAVYRLRLRTSLPDGTGSGKEPTEVDFRERKLFSQSGQKLIRRDANGYLLEVRKVSPAESVPLPCPLPAEPAAKAYLGANAYIEADDAEIIRTAREVVGTETEGWRAAQKLERWVHENVHDKNLATAFASAKEVLATRSGDCTEHSVLLTALARATGIPARVVSGLVYFDGAFVGHMWTEVYVGKWVPLDATRGDGSVGGDHIALVASSLEKDSVVEMFVVLMPFLGNLDIEVLEAR